MTGWIKVTSPQETRAYLSIDQLIRVRPCLTGVRFHPPAAGKRSSRDRITGDCRRKNNYRPTNGMQAYWKLRKSHGTDRAAQQGPPRRPLPEGHQTAFRSSESPSAPLWSRGRRSLPENPGRPTVLNGLGLSISRLSISTI